MKRICKTAIAALLAAGALMANGTAAQAGGASAGDARHSANLRVGTKAYRAHHRRCRKHRCARRYDRRAHGPRHRKHRAGYDYHYAGYWYSVVWWIPVRADSFGAHILNHAEWCRHQYGHYYDVRSNTYRASDGYSYRCIRPGGW